MSARFSSIQIRIEHLWALAVLIGIFAFVNTHPIRPNDFWFHIATARETLQSGQIPQVDTYSYFFAEQPFLSNNRFWLMQIAMYQVYTAGGAAWVVLTTSLVVTAAYAVLLGLGLQRSGNWRAAAFGILFAAVLGVDNWNVRPQVITYLYAALFLWGISKCKASSHGWWILLFPGLMALWVNSHGTFFIGIALLVFWFLDAAWQSLSHWRQTGSWEWKNTMPALAAGLMSGLACLANPQGAGFLHYLTTMSSSPVIQKYVLEWQPLDFNSAWGWIYVVFLLGTGMLLTLRPRGSLFDVLSFLFFGALGLKYGRAVVWFGIVMAPVVAGGLSILVQRYTHSSAHLKGSTPGEMKLNWIIAGMLVLLAAFSLPWFKSYWPVLPEKKGVLAYDTPVQATTYMLNAGLPQPVFHDLAFGSYLTWAAYPTYRVFVDPRFELYPESVWEDYVLISVARPDWEERLAAYGVQTLMLHVNNQAPLIEAVQADSDWEFIYSDEAAVIFVKR